MQPWDRRRLQAFKTLRETRADFINMTKGLYLETKHRRARGHCGDGVGGACRAEAGQPEYWRPSGQEAVSATSFQRLPLSPGEHGAHSPSRLTTESNQVFYIVPRQLLPGRRTWNSCLLGSFSDSHASPAKHRQRGWGQFSDRTSNMENK